MIRLKPGIDLTVARSLDYRLRVYLDFHERIMENNYDAPVLIDVGDHQYSVRGQTYGSDILVVLPDEFVDEIRRPSRLKVKVGDTSLGPFAVPALPLQQADCLLKYPKTE